MKNLVAKVIVFAAVCSVTWFAATPLRTKVSSAAPRPVDSRGPASGKERVSTAQDAPRAFAPVVTGLAKGVSSHARLNTLAIELVANRQVSIDGSVTVGDREDGYHYLWVTRVLRESGEAWTVPYLQQAFEVPLFQDSTPAFSDIIAVSPGKSWVRLALYRYPKSIDPTTFLDGPDDSRYSVVSVAKEINSP